MVDLKKDLDDHDLFRLGLYSQMEGNFRVHNGSYRFTFYLQQIDDIEELVSRIVDVPVKALKRRTYIQFYSKKLFNILKDMGFHRFSHNDWNIPKAYLRSESMKKEYLRGVIDSLGNVDVDRTVPYVRIQSVNMDGLAKVHDIYGGKLYESRGSAYLQWIGRDALAICEYLDWKFNGSRNIRGAQIIKNVNWESFRW